MPELVYGLCVITSFTCAVLLLRGYRRFRGRLLLWSALCFLGLAVSDAMLLAQTFGVVAAIEPWRLGAGLAGVSFLLYGLVFDSE